MEIAVTRVFRSLLVMTVAGALGLLVGVGIAMAERRGGSAQLPTGSTIADVSDHGVVGLPSATATPSPTPSATLPPAPPPPAVLWALDSYGTKVRDLEARLAQLRLVPSRWVDGRYGTATRDGVARFQGSLGLPETGAVDVVTWSRLRAATRTPSHAELYPPAAKPRTAIRLDERCLTGRVLCIDKTTRTLAWVVDGRVVMTLDVRFGSEFTPTREGEFSVYFKDADHVSALYGSRMPYAMFFSRGQAVHYSSDFAARGYAGASHGCVNVRDRAGIRALFGQVRVGDKVVVYRD
jgi:peptidoglycan hydrolase-like protein with peptidoglycan-binding domain